MGAARKGARRRVLAPVALPPPAGAASNQGRSPEQEPRRSLAAAKQYRIPATTTAAPTEKQPFEYDCPCGKRNTVRQGHTAPLFGCFKCSVEELAEAAGVSTWDLYDDPWTALARFAVGNGGRPRKAPAPVPSEERVSEWHRALLKNRKRRRQLHRERGLSLATVREFKLGWDDEREGYVLPVRDERGELANVSWRAPKGHELRRLGRSKHRLSGRTAEGGGLPLYPFPLPKGSLLLCEGEWDALVARQHGLPAITGLLGKQWHGAWDKFVVRRRVAVAYDVGAEAEAQRTAERIRAAGAREAWVVRLSEVERRKGRYPRPSKYGQVRWEEVPWEEGDDLGDWFVGRRRTADELRKVINEARR